MTVLSMLVAVLSIASLAYAESAEWLQGTWQGTHTAPYVRSDSTRFEFVVDKGAVRWKAFRDIEYTDGTHRTIVASGIVSGIRDDGATVDLEGKNDSADRFTGASVKYTLTRSVDSMTMTGRALTAGRYHYDVYLKRILSPSPPGALSTPPAAAPPTAESCKPTGRYVKTPQGILPECE